jgi:hypothetical protein
MSCNTKEYVHVGLASPKTMRQKYLEPVQILVKQFFHFKLTGNAGKALAPKKREEN